MATILTDSVLKQLADALPHNLLSAVLQLARQLGVGLKEQRCILHLAAVVFRSYELYQISGILKQLLGLSLDQAVARDYESELLQALTAD